jgi:hypothetical protein
VGSQDRRGSLTSAKRKCCRLGWMRGKDDALGHLLYGLGGSGAAEMRRGMVGSFNGFGRFGIEWESREDVVGHRFEKRRAGGAVDSASLGVEELAGGIGVAVMPAEGGGGGCSEALEEDDGQVGLHGPRG